MKINTRTDEDTHTRKHILTRTLLWTGIKKKKSKEKKLT